MICDNPQCRKEFIPTNKRNRFCSKHCKNQGYYGNHKSEFSRRNLLWKKKNPKGNAIIANRWRYKHPVEWRQSAIKTLTKKFIQLKSENGNLFQERVKKNKDLLRRFHNLTEFLFATELGKICMLCGSNKHLHIHHKKYDYPIVKDDLLLVCARCHLILHGTLGRRRKKIENQI